MNYTELWHKVVETKKNTDDTDAPMDPHCITGTIGAKQRSLAGRWDDVVNAWILGFWRSVNHYMNIYIYIISYISLSSYQTPKIEAYNFYIILKHQNLIKKAGKELRWQWTPQQTYGTTSRSRTKDHGVATSTLKGVHLLLLTLW